MTYRFTARIACGLDDPEQDDCMLAGLAESDGEGAFSMTFMCDFEEPSAQDVALGFDTHCLVTPDQNTAYGCVRSVELDEGVLRVTLDSTSLAALELSDPVVEVVLCAPEADVARMRHVLARILAHGRPDARPEARSLWDADVAEHPAE